MRKRLLVVMAAMLAFGSEEAQPQQTFSTGTSIASDNCIPFGCWAISRYQQVYSTSIFATASGAIWIDRVSFFYSGLDLPLTSELPLQEANYEVWLSATDAPVNGLSTNLSTNVGSTSYSMLFSGALSGNMSPGDGLDFVTTTVPFVYNPFAGQNLLVDIIVYGDPVPGDPLDLNLPNLPNHFDHTRTFYADAAIEIDVGGGAATGAEDISRAYTVEEPWKRLFVQVDKPAGSFADNHGLVTEFGTTTATQTVVPEPMTIALLATGLVGIAGAARRRRRRGVSEDC